MRQQRTLRHMIGCAGVGLHSGARVAVTLRPAAEGSGIRFRRVDRPGSPAILARVGGAVALDGVIALTDEIGTTVRMVEHLMAALAVCEIDNILVELSGPELPAMDGSALPFVRLMECAGTIEQARHVATLEVLRPIQANSADGFARLEPSSQRTLSLAVGDAGGLPAYSTTFSPEACKRELVSARERVGRAPDVDPAETSRHSILDALGGLALMPAWIEGHYFEHNADAALRCALLHALVADPGSCRWSGIGRDALDAPQAIALRRAS